jgi:hypothetical protein
MTGKMKDEPRNSYLLCVLDLNHGKKIPTHPTLALELHENSLPKGFTKDILKLRII